jgi:hypothetical protein
MRKESLYQNPANRFSGKLICEGLMTSVHRQLIRNL